MATVKKLVQETQEEKAARELAEYKLLLAEKDYRRTKTFMLACYTGNVEKIIECMKENVNVDAGDERGQTGLFYAISSGQPNIVNYLLDEGPLYIYYVIHSVELNITLLMQFCNCVKWAATAPL